MFSLVLIIDSFSSSFDKLLIFDFSSSDKFSTFDGNNAFTICSNAHIFVGITPLLNPLLHLWTFKTPILFL